MGRQIEENWHIVGVIPDYIGRQIGMGGTTPIWINDRIVDHIMKRHGDEIERLHTTAVSYVPKILSNFECVYRQVDNTLLFAMETPKTSRVAYVKLELGNSMFWRVKSAHSRKTNELNAYRKVFERKKAHY